MAKAANKAASKVISISIDEDLLEEIDKTAELLHLSRSAYVTLILSAVNGDSTEFLKTCWEAAKQNQDGKAGITPALA